MFVQLNPSVTIASKMRIGRMQIVNFSAVGASHSYAFCVLKIADHTLSPGIQALKLSSSRFANSITVR